MPQSEPPEEQRAAERVPVSWPVDCEAEDTFLYASIRNISELGIFVRTDKPLPTGTELTLRFSPRAGASFEMRGRVQWVNRVFVFGENLNPGMGIQFIAVSFEERARLVSAVRTIAYLRRDPVRYGAN